MLKKFEGIIGWLDRRSNRFFSHFGSIVNFAFELLYWSTLGIFHKKTFRRREILTQLASAGVDTLPIVAMVSFLVGSTLVLQSVFILERWGQKELVGGIVSITMTRELGPLITAIIYTGRVGAAYTAELGTMKVSEEILALETMAINPVAYLGAPRIISGFIALPALTILADFIGMAASFYLSTLYFGISEIGYNFIVQAFLKERDITFGIIKSVFFALVIIVISCYKGFTVEGGGEQVGKATMQAVVICIITVIFTDTVFTLIFNIMYN